MPNQFFMSFITIQYTMSLGQHLGLSLPIDSFITYLRNPPHVPSDNFALFLDSQFFYAETSGSEFVKILITLY